MNITAKDAKLSAVNEKQTRATWNHSTLLTSRPRISMTSSVFTKPTQALMWLSRINKQLFVWVKQTRWPGWVNCRYMYVLYVSSALMSADLIKGPHRSAMQSRWNTLCFEHESNLSHNEQFSGRENELRGLTAVCRRATRSEAVVGRPHAIVTSQQGADQQNETHTAQVAHVACRFQTLLYDTPKWKQT